MLRIVFVAMIDFAVVVAAILTVIIVVSAIIITCIWLFL